MLHTKLPKAKKSFDKQPKQAQLKAMDLPSSAKFGNIKAFKKARKKKKKKWCQKRQQTQEEKVSNSGTLVAESNTMTHGSKKKFCQKQGQDSKQNIF